MKKILTTGALVLCSLGLSSVALAANEANGQQVPSNAEIKLVEDPLGPLRFNKVTDIDFGVRKIAGNNVDYRANYLPADDLGKYRSNYVQVVDNRGSNQGWQLQVSASPFKTADQIELKRTTLIFSATAVKKLAVDPLTQSIDQHAETLVTPNAEWQLQAEQVITETPTTIVTAKKQQGMGVHNLYLGDVSNVPSDDEDVTTQNDAIVLKVPGEVTKEKTTYTSIVTWSLLDEPSI